MRFQVDPKPYTLSWARLISSALKARARVLRELFQCALRLTLSPIP